VLLMLPPQNELMGLSGYAFNLLGLVLTAVLVMIRRRGQVQPAAG